MAQFEAFSSGVEVNGQTVLSVVAGMPTGQSERAQLLARHQIVNPKPGSWHLQQAWLDAFREISEQLGAEALFAIGQSIPHHAQFPPMDTLQQALKSINVAYHVNHRGGEIGYYRLRAFDAEARQAQMECKNPYPAHFDRGIIYALVSRFRPQDSQDFGVDWAPDQPNRLSGADTCHYRLWW